jgi:hypothetical protein
MTDDLGGSTRACLCMTLKRQLVRSAIFALVPAAATGSDESRGVILNPDGAIWPRRRAEPASQSGEQEFPKGCRNKRPYTLHRTALLWSNRNEVWGRTSSI